MRLPKDEEYLDFIALLGPVCAYLLLSSLPISFVACAGTRNPGTFILTTELSIPNKFSHHLTGAKVILDSLKINNKKTGSLSKNP
jgi:hypothetical protein